MRKISASMTGLSRSACGGQGSDELAVAHSHPAADPSDTGLDQVPFEARMLLFT